MKKIITFTDAELHEEKYCTKIKLEPLGVSSLCSFAEEGNILNWRIILILVKLVRLLISVYRKPLNYCL